MRDPYRVLGVDGDAKLEEIKAAFKVLARRFHPDLNDAPDAEEQFKEINHAHQIVGDPTSRALWDEFGEESLSVHFNVAAAREAKSARLFKNRWSDMDVEARAAREASDAEERKAFELRAATPWRSTVDRRDPGPFGAMGAWGPKGPGSW